MKRSRVWISSSSLALIVSFAIQPKLSATVYAKPTSGSTSVASVSASKPNSAADASTSTGTADVTGALDRLQRLAGGLATNLAGQQALETLASAAAGAQPMDSTGSGSSSTSSTTGSGAGSQGQTGQGSTGSQSEPTRTNLSTSVYYFVQNSLLYKHDSSGFTYVVGPPANFMKPQTRYYADKTSFYELQGASFVYAGTYENPYRTLDLRTGSSLTTQQIANYISTNDALSPLISLAPVYLQAQSQYGVNAQYLVAHSIIESTWGSSQIAHDKNNLFGYSAYDSSPYASATTFPTKAYAILYEAWFVRKYYLDSTGSFFHGPNLDGMNVDYATDPNWSESIAAVMWNMAPMTTGSTNTTVLPEATTEPVFSYPAGVKGQVTTSGLHVRQGPGLGYSILTQLDSGTTVNITGWVPGWYQIAQSPGKFAYVSSQYVRMTNLGLITADGVNLRAGPETNQTVLRQLKYADQIELLGLSADKQWQHVTTMDNVTGYVYSSYVTAMH